MNAICISGATGSIGMALIKKCIREKVKVYVLLRPDSGRADRVQKLMQEAGDLVEIIPADLCDFARMAAEDSQVIDLSTVDVFYHFAWAGTFGDSRNNMELQAANEQYALDAVRLARRMGAKAFIGAGSQAEYGRVEGMLTADTPTNPENGYGIYKNRAGQSTRELAHELGMSHVWTRILSVYGPFDGKDTMIMSTISKLLRGEKPSLTKGEQIWDYLFSEDAGNAMYMLGDGAVKENTVLDGHTFVIGSGIGRPLREYIEIMRDAINPKLPLGLGEVPYGPKQVMHLQADISELNAATGFVPHVSFEDGIRRTIEYVKSL